MQIARKNMTIVDGELFVDASRVGIMLDAPIVVTMGGVDFRRTQTVEQDGMVLGWEYRSEMGKRLTVANV